MEGIISLHSMAQVDFSELFRVYDESLLCHARRDYPDLPLEIAMQYEQQDFMDDCRCFFADGGKYCVLAEDGQYRSALCIEHYGDGILISALETAPGCRRRGYGRKLLLAVTEAERENLYSHVAKNNKASLALHACCGFYVLKDTARLIDGTVSTKYCTMAIKKIIS